MKYHGMIILLKSEEPCLLIKRDLYYEDIYETYTAGLSEDIYETYAAGLSGIYTCFRKRWTELSIDQFMKEGWQDHQGIQFPRITGRYPVFRSNK